MFRGCLLDVCRDMTFFTFVRSRSAVLLQAYFSQEGKLSKRRVLFCGLAEAISAAPRVRMSRLWLSSAVTGPYSMLSFPKTHDQALGCVILFYFGQLVEYPFMWARQWWENWHIGGIYLYWISTSSDFCIRFSNARTNKDSKGKVSIVVIITILTLC